MARSRPTQRSYIAPRTNVLRPAPSTNNPSSVYVKNLEESIKIPALIESLREIFAEYGNVIDIIAKGSLKRKGQAFVVFDSEESAQNAIDEVNGFELFDKQLSCDFAKTRSDATIKRVGTEEELETHKRKRLAEKGLHFPFLVCQTENVHKESMLMKIWQSANKP